VARRRELADVCDGISGHFILSPEWTRGGQLALVAGALRAGDGDTIRIDLLNGEISAPSLRITRLADELTKDLQRHLRARGIPREWIRSATFSVHVGEWSPGQTAIVKCRVAIVDDRGSEHTSTRSGERYVPRASLFSAILSRRIPHR
jgi:hypothetical protein